MKRGSGRGSDSGRVVAVVGGLGGWGQNRGKGQGGHKAGQEAEAIR